MQVVERWPRCPETALWFDEQMHNLRVNAPHFDQYASYLLRQSGVEIGSIVDHWKFPPAMFHDELGLRLGMESIATDCWVQWTHRLACVPDVLVSDVDVPMPVLRVESLRQFSDCTGWIVVGGAGDDDSAYAESQFLVDGLHVCAAVRQAQTCCCPGRVSADYRERLAHARELLLLRDRTGTDEQALATAHLVANKLIGLIGRDRAAEEFFRAERDYYMSRNNAALYQYRLQEDAGIGWANHDHHTYRSSRTEFRQLLNLFESLGFYRRERFYAGVEAGWGAQVMEHPVSRVVLFCDVDLTTSDLHGDFTETELPPSDVLKTIGLWCALHGCSIGVAGMHHLEAEFNFEQAALIMEQSGYSMMPPFTDLPMLKQAFTLPEFWTVSPERARVLLECGAITREQANSFTRVGAAGSHLEILQRWEGYRGFNKTGVSKILLATDARLVNVTH